MTKSFPQGPKAPKTTKRKGGNLLDSEDRLGGGDADDSFVPVDEDSHFSESLDDEEVPDEHGDDGKVDATDDPVRMYLMQMGAIPLLNRFETTLLCSMTISVEREWPDARRNVGSRDRSRMRARWAHR